MDLNQMHKNDMVFQMLLLRWDLNLLIHFSCWFEIIFYQFYFFYLQCILIGTNSHTSGLEEKVRRLFKRHMIEKVEMEFHLSHGCPRSIWRWETHSIWQRRNTLWGFLGPLWSKIEEEKENLLNRYYHMLLHTKKILSLAPFTGRTMLIGGFSVV